MPAPTPCPRAHLARHPHPHAIQVRTGRARRASRRAEPPFVARAARLALRLRRLRARSPPPTAAPQGAATRPSYTSSLPPRTPTPIWKAMLSSRPASSAVAALARSLSPPLLPLPLQPLPAQRPHWALVDAQPPPPHTPRTRRPTAHPRLTGTARRRRAPTPLERLIRARSPRARRRRRARDIVDGLEVCGDERAPRRAR